MSLDPFRSVAGLCLVLGAVAAGCRTPANASLTKDNQPSGTPPQIPVCSATTMPRGANALVRGPIVAICNDTFHSAVLVFYKGELQLSGQAFMLGIHGVGSPDAPSDALTADMTTAVGSDVAKGSFSTHTAVADGDIGLHFFDAQGHDDNNEGKGYHFTLTSAAQELPVLDVGPNLPTGHSLFDYLISGQDGTAMPAGVPYPFENLVAWLRSKSNGCIGGILIPRGRSLQKEAAAPKYFEFPRIVLTASDGVCRNDDGQSTPRVDVLGKIFIGYAEPAKQLEVISFNETMGRFEFQIVTNYDTPPAVPQVFYAERAVCTACHQGQAPIFPRATWNETNGNPAIAALIQQKMPGKSRFHGIPIGKLDSGIDADDVIDDLGQRPADVDNTVREASGLQLRNIVWQLGCGQDDPRGIECRAALLRQTAASLLALNSYPQAEQDATLISEMQEKYLKPTFPGGPVLPDSGFSPLPISTDVTDLTAVENSVVAFSASGALDPVVGRRADSTFLVSFSSTSLADVLTNGFGGNFSKIMAAIASLSAKTKVGQSHAFGNVPFTRCNVVGALWSETGKPAPKMSCPEEAQGIPAPQLPPVPDNAGGADGDPRLAPFKMFCLPCHGSEPLPPFMKGTDDQIIQALKASGRPSDIFRRLNWESVPPPVGIMPPPTSAQHQILAKPENTSKRVQMQILMKQFGAQ